MNQSYEELSAHLDKIIEESEILSKSLGERISKALETSRELLKKLDNNK